MVTKHETARGPAEAHRCRHAVIETVGSIGGVAPWAQARCSASGAEARASHAEAAVDAIADAGAATHYEAQPLGLGTFNAMTSVTSVGERLRFTLHEA